MLMPMSMLPGCATVHGLRRGAELLRAWLHAVHQSTRTIGPGAVLEEVVASRPGCSWASMRLAS